MRRREEAYESPARSLFWLEQPVCLEWTEENGGGSSSRWPGGSLLTGIGFFLARVFRSQPSRDRQG
jgi:hypothetical protein